MPKNLIFGVAGAIAAFLIILVAAFAMINSSKVIDLNKYIIFESSEYEGYGKASIRVDWESLKKDYGKKIKYSSKGKKRVWSFDICFSACICTSVSVLSSTFFDLLTLFFLILSKEKDDRFLFFYRLIS